MDIKLLSMKLKNFKGIKSFTLDINGADTNVFGENGTGKTTLYDAFLWILFDKDSNNRKDFNIKTLDSNNEVIHGLEHEVEVVLSIDNVPVKLRKMFMEKWTKKRGEASKEFTGHETLYWVDDVSVKKSEYGIRINSIIDETIFKLITNPFYFNTMLNWQDRRKTLLTIAGNVSDEEVIHSNKKLAKLLDVLSGKDIDDYKKILHERIKKLNDDIAKIPIKIDELNNTLLTEIEKPDYDALEVQKNFHLGSISNIEKELASAAEATKKHREKQQLLFKKQDELRALKLKIDEVANAQLDDLFKEKLKLIREEQTIKVEIGILEKSIANAEHNIALLNEEIIQLRENWTIENSKTFIEPDEDNFICPTCGQGLPTEQIEFKIQEMKANFMKNKKAALDAINEKGRAKKAALEFNQKELQEQQTILENKKARLELIENQLDELEEAIKAPRPAVNYNDNPDYTALEHEIKELENELQRSIADNTQVLLDKKAALQEKVDELNKILNNRDIEEKTRARIEELRAEERALAEQISELEGHKFLIEEFIKAKVNILEDNINSKFKTVKFKLFDTQINGGVVECCETLINTNGSWVPWSDANNAGRINAGLDIINTLTKHYKVNAPIFIDNRESVNELIETDSQIINLFVSRDKKMKVEVA